MSLIEEESNNTNDTESMLTTIDNPYDPFTQFNDWYNYDCEKKYFTSEYLDRIANTNNSMTEKEIDEAIHKAMLEIVYYNPDLYIVVHKNND